MSSNRKKVVEMLKHAYCMELETVMNYMANSTNLDGVRAEQIKQSLAPDVLEEIGHAQLLGRRIKQLGGLLRGSAGIELGQQPQPPSETTDVGGVIEGVISAENAACEHYLAVKSGRSCYRRPLHPSPRRRRGTFNPLQGLFKRVPVAKLAAPLHAILVENSNPLLDCWFLEVAVMRFSIYQYGTPLAVTIMKNPNETSPLKRLVLDLSVLIRSAEKTSRSLRHGPPRLVSRSQIVTPCPPTIRARLVQIAVSQDVPASWLN